ncbi:MAG TPA: GNAT family N-acetyltransferase [Candidatus Limnocylindrales bacterium]|nr:GNAT family N-acetyltransferase [Candidatus Limnocylindrales bacterium]
MTSIHEATAEELVDWDERTVDAPGGHVYQGLTWAEHRERSGWTADRLVFEDGYRVLALRRRWPLVGGWSAYVPRGPVAGLESAAETADRLAAVVEHLASRGVAVVGADAEIPASSGYGAELRRRGFHPIEEIQPSRHRISLALAGRSEDEVFAGISKSTRQRIRKAEEVVTDVIRHDGRIGPSGPGVGFRAAGEPVEVALDRFYDLLLETGERKHFAFGPRDAFLGWWRAAVRAGHLVYLEAWGIRGAPVAGLILYRHGERLTTVHSGDHAEDRDETPGALHLLRWRAIQLAMREGREEMDLGGADVAGARREPRDGEPMWGLYQHKRSFGGEWLELTGAQERIIDPTRYRAGRVAARLARMLGR